MTEDLEMVRGIRDASATGSSCESIRTGPTLLRRGPNLPDAWNSTTWNTWNSRSPRTAERRELVAEAKPHADRTERKRHRPGERDRHPPRRRRAFILPDTHIAGGILPCVSIGRICEAAGLPCIMHCGHDLGRRLRRCCTLPRPARRTLWRTIRPTTASKTTSLGALENRARHDRGARQAGLEWKATGADRPLRRRLLREPNRPGGRKD